VNNGDSGDLGRGCGESLSAANIRHQPAISVRYAEGLVMPMYFLILFMRPPVFVSRRGIGKCNAAIIAKYLL